MGEMLCVFTRENIYSVSVFFCKKKIGPNSGASPPDTALKLRLFLAKINTI